MSITNVRARFGLSLQGALTREGVLGTATVGIGNEEIKLTTANDGHTVRILMAPAAVLETNLGLFEYDEADPAVEWVAGTAQVDTATAAGTISTGGNASVTVTSAGMTGSPKVVTFAVAALDTATQWAVKARAALTADAVIAARFTVGGSGTAIVLTRKPINTFTVAGTAYPFYPADDGTLNMALADVTSDGITEAATSANTTPGVATSGTRIFGGGVNYQGLPTAGVALAAMDVRSNSGAVTIAGTGETLKMQSGGRACLYKCWASQDPVITAGSAPVDMEICLAGSIT